MAYISPNSTVKILRDVPLSVDNEHSIAFSSKAEQETYFNSKAKYTLTQYSYIREGVLRVEKCADDIYECNYLMFQNSAYGNKIFYAFIIDITWVNNITAEIEYLIDYLQTWLFDYTYKPCWIERTHTQTDNFGESLTPEPFTIDDYVYNSYLDFDVDTTEMAIIIGVVALPEGQTVSGKIYQGIYGGLTLIPFLSTHTAGINNFLSNFNVNPEQVVSMYIVPRILIDSIQGVVYGQPIPESDRGFDIPVQLHGIDTTSALLNGYRPKNKKLYTYPYNFMRIDNGSQETLTLRYELFANSDQPPFGRIYGTFQGEPELQFRPVSYRNLLTRTGNEDVLTMNNYPELSWNNDSYIQWKTINKISNFQQIANAGVNLIKGAYSIKSGEVLTTQGINTAKKNSTKERRAVSGEISRVGATINTASQLMNDVLSIGDNYYQASLVADQFRGSICNSSTLIATKRKGYHEARLSIRREQAIIIDNFFTMFGYSIQKIETPNRKNRPYWTFIKTGGCIVTGNIPTDAKTYIQNRHNAGITWWTSGDVLGNYQLDNSPSSNS